MQPPFSEDRQLVDRCLSGDPAAWDALVREKGPLLSGVARRTLKRAGRSADPAQVDDIVQDAFASLAQDGGAALRRFQWGCALDHYLVSILQYKAIALIRRDLNWLSLEQETGAASLWKDAEADPQADPALQAEARDRGERLAQAMAKLPRREHLALRLFYWRSLPVGTIGRLLGLKPDSVWTHLVRARRHLAEILRKAPPLLFF